MNQRWSFFSALGRLEGLPIVIVLLVLYGALMLSAPTVFLRWPPLIYMSFLETVPPELFVALGLTLVITAGEIDLSFPALIAFAWVAFSWRSSLAPVVGGRFCTCVCLAVEH